MSQTCVVFYFIVFVFFHYLTKVSTQEPTSNILSVPAAFSLDDVNNYLLKLGNNTFNSRSFTTSCKRTCTSNERRICYLNFYLEYYSAMGPGCNNCAKGIVDDCFNKHCVMADGVERGVMTINRMIPGPHIEVCKNDLVIIDVINAMAGTASTIHWHGMLQSESQYMDGVPFVTQCPISYNNGFRYTFWARDPGTHFYHSHTGHHKTDGHFGAMTVREPARDDPNSQLYDVDDNVIIISDWQHDISSMFDPGLPSRKPGNIPENILINGKGKYVLTTKGVTTVTPYELIHFKSGLRYRLRFINSASHFCPMQIQIGGHNMTVIASDGHSVKPHTVDSIVTYAGERYDVVVNAVKSSGVFWMVVKGLGACKPLEIYQVALVAYNQDPNILWMNTFENKPTYHSIPDGLMLNHPNITINARNVVSVTELVAVDIDQSILSSEPDVRLVMSFSNRLTDYDTIFNSEQKPHFLYTENQRFVVGTMNGITTTFPSSPYLSQPRDIDQQSICNANSLPRNCANKTFCICNHLQHLPLNAVVEILLLDESTETNNVNHPIHLHGHRFYVTEIGQGHNGITLTRDIVMKLEANGTRITTTKQSAPIKDTVSVPSSGYVVLRFRADNPGFWLMHCHIDPHMLSGMIMTFQVGEVADYSSPPRDFPKCGDFSRTILS